MLSISILPLAVLELALTTPVAVISSWVVAPMPPLVAVRLKAALLISAAPPLVPLMAVPVTFTVCPAAAMPLLAKVTMPPATRSTWPLAAILVTVTSFNSPRFTMAPVTLRISLTARSISSAAPILPTPIVRVSWSAVIRVVSTASSIRLAAVIDTSPRPDAVTVVTATSWAPALIVTSSVLPPPFATTLIALTAPPDEVREIAPAAATTLL